MRSEWLLAGIVIAWASLPGSASDGKPILWQPPGNITTHDWTWGPGGEEHAPKPPFEFLEEESGGTNAKIKVRDAKGDHWIVKFGSENHSEIFASRLLYALGYVTEPNYFVLSGVVNGAHGLHRAKPFIGKDGSFAYARFKLRNKEMLARAEDEKWSWVENPFLGTRELNGLKILLMLTSNWDGKDSRNGAGSNTAVYTKPGASHQLFYSFDDWGATMGKWGGFFKRDKWNPDGYRQQTKSFARSTGQGIEWGYRGKHNNDITSGIGMEDVEWLLTYLSRVTDEELRAGLRSSGATAEAIDIYSRALRDRISQLERLAAPASPAAGSVAASDSPSTKR